MNSKIKLNLEEIITEVEINLSHGTVYKVLLSKERYKQNSWYSKLLHFDEIASGLCIDLFTQTLQKLGAESIKIFLFNNNHINYIATINATNETIEDVFLLSHMEKILLNDKDKVAEVIVSSIIITNEDLSFVVIIDKDREFYYFYGDENFIKDIFPFTSNGYKNYYDKLCYFAKDNLDYLELDYLEWFWKSYISTRTKAPETVKEPNLTVSKNF